MKVNFLRNYKFTTLYVISYIADLKLKSKRTLIYVSRSMSSNIRPNLISFKSSITQAKTNLKIFQTNQLKFDVFVGAETLPENSSLVSSTVLMQYDVDYITKYGILDT